MELKKLFHLETEINVVNNKYASDDEVLQAGIKIQNAFWYFNDVCSVKYKVTKIRNLSTFLHLYDHLIPDIVVSRFLKRFDILIKKIPVSGVILFDKTMKYVLLVRNNGNQQIWSYPKGKLSPNESNLDCALRELHEETGILFDEKHFEYLGEIKEIICNKYAYFYVFKLDLEITDVKLKPENRYEIADVAWHPVELRPNCKYNIYINKLHPLIKTVI